MKHPYSIHENLWFWSSFDGKILLLLYINIDFAKGSPEFVSGYFKTKKNNKQKFLFEGDGGKSLVARQLKNFFAASLS